MPTCNAWRLGYISCGRLQGPLKGQRVLRRADVVTQKTTVRFTTNLIFNIIFVSSCNVDRVLHLDLAGAVTQWSPYRFTPNQVYWDRFGQQTCINISCGHWAFSGTDCTHRTWHCHSQHRALHSTAILGELVLHIFHITCLPLPC